MAWRNLPIRALNTPIALVPRAVPRNHGRLAGPASSRLSGFAKSQNLGPRSVPSSFSPPSLAASASARHRVWDGPQLRGQPTRSSLVAAAVLGPDSRCIHTSGSFSGLRAGSGWPTMVSHSCLSQDGLQLIENAQKHLLREESSSLSIPASKSLDSFRFAVASSGNPLLGRAASPSPSVGYPLATSGPLASGSPFGESSCRFMSRVPGGPPLNSVGGLLGLGLATIVTVGAGVLFGVVGLIGGVLWFLVVRPYLAFKYRNGGGGPNSLGGWTPPGSMGSNMAGNWQAPGGANSIFGQPSSPQVGLLARLIANIFQSQFSASVQAHKEILAQLNDADVIHDLLPGFRGVSMPSQMSESSVNSNIRYQAVFPAQTSSGMASISVDATAIPGSDGDNLTVEFQRVVVQTPDGTSVDVTHEIQNRRPGSGDSGRVIDAEYRERP